MKEDKSILVGTVKIYRKLFVSHSIDRDEMLRRRVSFIARILSYLWVRGGIYRTIVLGT